ncbi:MAG: PH domain-containing protein [Thaumarchaeota archaeon]|nr:PH domain-containing protein [Nitrososphaerota archaeon]
MQSLPDDLKSILGPSEEVQLYIRQKIYHPKINIDSVVITNERIILRHPHAMRLKNDYTDFNYQDVSNVLLEKGILRSTVKCTLRFGGEPLALSGLPNSDAQRAYGLIRENLVRYQSPLTAVSTGMPPYRQTMAPLQSSSGSCRKCGSPLVAGHRFCGNCGSPV